MVAPEANPDTDASNSAGDVDVDLIIAETFQEVANRILPHDRKKMLLSDDGPTDWFLNSARRWVTTMLADEGVHEPIESGTRRTKAEIHSRESGVLAGLYVVDLLLREWMPGARFTWTGSEGAEIEKGNCILTIEACRHQILVCERVILNILAHLSGIATNTAKWVANSQIPLAATRKTTWGVLDKAAVSIGGGLTHRLNRPDALMLKENDLATTAENGEQGSKRVRSILRDLPLESIGAFATIEVRTLDEALAAAETWAERLLETDEKTRLNIMLDNMGPEITRDAALDLETRGLREYLTLEASGNVSFDSLETWQLSRVDVISTSQLHRGAQPLDLTCIFQGA
jgi:nicotinate-nucleotide pyrophosphorylase (carboxylating)